MGSLLGYLMLSLELDAAALMLGFILGESFRRAILLSRWSFRTFVSRPIGGTPISPIGIFIGWQVAAFFVQAQKGGRPTDAASRTTRTPESRHPLAWWKSNVPA